MFSLFPEKNNFRLNDLGVPASKYMKTREINVSYSDNVLVMNVELTEESISSRFGKENPFRVPAGYFDDFAGRMMALLPEQQTTVEKRNMWQRLRPVLAAAVVVGVIGSVGIYLFDRIHNSQQSSAPRSSVAKSDYHSDDLDMTADYVMMDEQDMYAYISGE